ncbi:MAG: hypothetical protein M0R02_06290 [Bacteroidales bacterium]|nr:hypothetical protein [Bacteroidales bacterium]
MNFEIPHPNFIANYFLLICMMFFSFGVGWMFFSFVLRKKTFLKTSNLFIQIVEKSLFGITIIICSIALFYTKGISVQIISFFSLLFLTFFANKNKQIINKDVPLKLNWKEYIVLLAISFIIYLFHYYSFHLPDFVYYGKLSKSLINVKNESILTLYNSYGVNQTLSLYHFGELWLNGFISSFFSLNSIFSLKIIIYPFFHFLTFILLCGLISKKRNVFLSLILTFGLLYGSSILFYPILTPEQGHYTFWFYGLPDLTSFKTLIVYPFILLSLLYLYEDTLIPFLCLLVIISVNFFTIWVAITGALFMLLMYIVLIKDYYTIPKILLSIFLLLFIYILPFIFKQDSNSNSNIIHHIYPLPHYFINFKEYIVRFLNYFSRSFALYPFALLGGLLGYKFLTKKDKKVLLFIFFCIISSVLFITFLYSIRESTQALSNILAPIMIFATYLCWKRLNEKKQLIFSILFCLFAVLNIYKTYSIQQKITLSEFEQELYTFSQNNLQNKNWAYYSERYWSTFAYSGYIVSSSMLLANNTIMPVEIAPVFDLYSADYYKRNAIYPLQKIHNSVPELLVFFEEKSIQYIYIENIDIIPAELKKHIIPRVIQNSKGIYEII